MANPYDGLFGSPAALDNPYLGLLAQPAGLALLDQQARDREKKRAELARIAAQGDVGRVATPDTSFGAIGKEALKMVGASLAENAASMPSLAESVEALPETLIRHAAGMAPRQSAIDRDPAYSSFKGAVDKVYGDQVQALATATQDLHPGLSSALYLGTELGGQMLEPTFAGSGAVLRGERAAAQLAPRVSTDLEEALARPITARETEAAAARGVPPANPGFGTGRDADAFGAWLDRAGLSPQDATPDLQAQFFEVHNPEPALVGAPHAPSPELRAAFPDATIDSRDVYEGGGTWGRDAPLPQRDLEPVGSTAGARVAGVGEELAIENFHRAAGDPVASYLQPQDQTARVLRAIRYGEDGAVNDNLLGPQRFTPPSGEAGFVRNPWAPESDIYQQGYQIRHDYVTDQNAAVYSSGQRAQDLQRAIPSRALREDMTAVFHGTENPLVKGDTFAAAQDRVRASPYGQQADDAIAAWRQRSDELWQMAHDAGAEDLGYWKDYMHMVYEPPKGEKAIVGSEMGQGTTTSVMKERHFANPAEAMALGYKPRSLDFSVLMHETEKAHAYTRSVLGLMDDLGEVNEKAIAQGIKDPPIVRAAVNPDPESYVRVSGYPILERAAPGRVDPEAVQMARKLTAEAAESNGAVQAQRFQPMIPGMEDMGPKTMEAPAIPQTPPNIYVHKDLWRNLTPVLEHDNPAALDKALSVVKRINFFGSLFHGMSLTEASIGSMGPARGLFEAGRRGFGVPGISQLAARLGSGRIGEDAALEAIRAGVSVEPPRLDVMQSTFGNMLRQGEQGLFRPQSSPLAPRNLLAKALAATRKTAEFYDEALWANYHAPLKVTAYHVNLEKELASPKIKGLIASGKLTEDSVRQSVARQINNHFGGQNWQLLQNDLFNNPTATRWMRRVFLSPDWNYSAISTGVSPFSADPVARQMGNRYWKNMLGVALGWQMLNRAMTGHFMWDNEPGHAFDLETGLKDDKGRKIFYQVGKHAMEAPDFLTGRERATGREVPIASFLLRKLNPVLQGAGTAVFGKSSTGIPGALERAREDADKQGRPLSGHQEMGARLQDFASGLVPFISSDVLTHDQKTGDYQTHPGAMLRRMVIPFSERKGLSLHDGQVLLAEAARNRDYARAAQIRKWLQDNGYTGKQITRAGSQGRHLAQKFPDEGDDGGADVVVPGATPNNNPYAGMFNNGGNQ